MCFLIVIEASCVKYFKKFKSDEASDGEFSSCLLCFHISFTGTNAPTFYQVKDDSLIDSVAVDKCLTSSNIVATTDETEFGEMEDNNSVDCEVIIPLKEAENYTNSV